MTFSTTEHLIISYFLLFIHWMLKSNILSKSDAMDWNLRVNLEILEPFGVALPSRSFLVFYVFLSEKNTKMVSSLIILFTVRKNRNKKYSKMIFIFAAKPNQTSFPKALNTPLELRFLTRIVHLLYEKWNTASQSPPHLQTNSSQLFLVKC